MKGRKDWSTGRREIAHKKAAKEIVGGRRTIREISKSRLSISDIKTRDPCCVDPGSLLGYPCLCQDEVRRQPEVTTCAIYYCCLSIKHHQYDDP